MDVGWQELMVVLVVILVVFGAGKLPEAGSALGKGIREFRSAARDAPPDASSAPASDERPLAATSVVSDEV